MEEDLDAAAKKAEEAEEVENKMYDDFQKDMKKELDSKMAALRQGASAASRIDTVQDRLVWCELNLAQCSVEGGQYM